MSTTETVSDARPGLKPRLPHWADKSLHGEVELYAQLATRDGRWTGNGTVIEVIEETEGFPPHPFYMVLSDFGNGLVLSAERPGIQF